MTLDIVLTLAILLAAVILFVTERLRVDLVALLVLVSLVLTGLVTPAEALSGFSNPAVVTVWAVFILSAALAATGVANTLGRGVLRFAGTGETQLLVIIMAVAALLSAFMNNVGVAALLLPVVLTIARQTERSPSRLLLPLAAGCLLGGQMTLIGTPPNILASDALREAGYAPFTLFDFAPIGVILVIVGIAFMVLLGRRMLPARHPVQTLTAHPNNGEKVEDVYHLDERLTVLELPPGSPLSGKTVVESDIGRVLGVTILGLQRQGRKQLKVKPHTVLMDHDQLLVAGRLDLLRQFNEEREGVLPALIVRSRPDQDKVQLRSEEMTLVEAVLSPHSNLVGKTLRDIQFREKYGMDVLAIWRGGRAYRSDLADMPLQFGDAFLLYGPRSQIKLIGREPDFLVLADEELDESRRLHKAPLAVAIMAGMVVTVLLGWLPIAIAAITAGVLMILSGALDMEEAYRNIEWRAVFLIAGMLPLGIAMEQSGTASFLAEGLVALAANGSSTLLLAAVFLLTSVASQFMPNPVVTVLLAPIAIRTAVDLGLSPHSLMMVVAIAASASFMSPVGHPANILVMGPGGYRFTDYMRVGIPLTLLTLLVTLLVLPIFWPLQ